MAAPWARGAQVRIVGEIHGQETNNVLHLATNTIVVDGGPLNEMLLALAEALRDCVIEFLLPAVTSDWKFIRVEALEIYPTRTDPVVVTGVPENVGELSAASVSFESSVVNIRTGVAGRRGRGRMFLPPPGEGQVAASVVDGPTLVLIAAFTACVATKFMGAAPTTPWHLGILSRKSLSGIGGSFDNSFNVAVSLNPNADVGCMRSRRKGHGI